MSRSFPLYQPIAPFDVASVRCTRRTSSCLTADTGSGTALYCTALGSTGADRWALSVRSHQWSSDAISMQSPIDAISPSSICVLQLRACCTRHCHHGAWSSDQSDSRETTIQTRRTNRLQHSPAAHGLVISSRRQEQDDSANGNEWMNEMTMRGSEQKQSQRHSQKEADTDTDSSRPRPRGAALCLSDRRWPAALSPQMKLGTTGRRVGMSWHARTHTYTPVGDLRTCPQPPPPACRLSVHPARLPLPSCPACAMSAQPPAFENADKCRKCSTAFSLFTRKHHCRNWSAHNDSRRTRTANDVGVAQRRLAQQICWPLSGVRAMHLAVTEFANHSRVAAVRSDSALSEPGSSSAHRWPTARSCPLWPAAVVIVQRSHLLRCLLCQHHPAAPFWHQ